jgi:nucleotide-binding universal stress UspA family protein
MMIHHLMIAYDGSDQSRKAFDMGLDIATQYRAQVTVLSVARPPEPPVAVEMEAVIDSATEYYRGQFNELKDKAQAIGIEPEFEIRIGHPAEQIIILANQLKTDAIVMGHRGESFLQKWLLGSVARRVLSYAHCTVVVVR